MECHTRIVSVSLNFQKEKKKKTSQFQDVTVAVAAAAVEVTKTAITEAVALSNVLLPNKTKQCKVKKDE